MIRQLCLIMLWKVNRLRIKGIDAKSVYKEQVKDDLCRGAVYSYEFTLFFLSLNKPVRFLAE